MPAGSVHWIPDMADSLFQEAHFRFIEELGKRYDGHPDLDFIDIGTVGLWGEWHMSGTDVDMPSPETCQAIIDVYHKAFPTTPKVMLINYEPGVTYSVGKGSGWRADCLGDLGFWGDTWNHMRDSYPQAIEKSGATDAWKAGPVVFESCYDMLGWVQNAYDIRYIFDYALDYHVSYMNNKSAPLPEGAAVREEVERFVKKMGYRLVLAQLEHHDVRSTGSSLLVDMVWNNVGVAPPYKDYFVAVRFTDASGKASVSVSNTSIKGWLPGNIDTTASVALPNEPGQYDLALAIVDPVARFPRNPAIQLAIEGSDWGGWYPLSQIVLQRSRPPVLSEIADQIVNEGELFSFQVQATDEDNDPITYTATGLPAGASFEGSTFSWTPDYDLGGMSYEVSFTASDGTDTVSLTVPVTVANVDRSLVITATTPTRGVLLGVLGDTVRVSVSASSPDVGPLIYVWTVNGTAQGETGPAFSHVVSEADLSDTVSVSVSDGVLTQVQSWTVIKTLQGDFNGDMRVDFPDFLMFVRMFGQTASDPDFDARMDLNGDDTVGFTDFISFVRLFGLGM